MFFAAAALIAVWVRPVIFAVLIHIKAFPPAFTLN